MNYKYKLNFLLFLVYLIYLNDRVLKLKFFVFGKLVRIPSNLILSFQMQRLIAPLVVPGFVSPTQ